MHLKIIYLPVLLSLLFLSNGSNSQALKTKKDCPVTIFYGPNESHSNSWVQTTSKGLAGICYFKTDNTSAKNEGSLMYRTININDNQGEETICNGSHLEVCVLLFDTASNPHIFVASSGPSDQVLIHFFKNTASFWEQDTIMHFYNEGGLHINELSADNGSNNSFHLLALITRSNPDSDDYYDCFRGASLYHVSNATGEWQKERIQVFDMVWTLDEYSKMLNRQDIEIDKQGFVHIVFGQQVNAASRLCYSTNKSGNWVTETAVNFNSGTRDDGGWYPSLCLDKQEIPNISCAYIRRVPTGSAISAHLLLVTRIGESMWNSETIATTDDGYYGTDGRNYTGGITHLVFDKSNTPHLIFTDIASSHSGMNYFNLGNIRYAVKKNGHWDISTLYRQALPNGFFDATEIYGLCLLVSDSVGKIQVVAQQLVVNGSTNYQFSLVHCIVANATSIEIEKKNDFHYNTPNPFRTKTKIVFQLLQKEAVKLRVYQPNGKCISELLHAEMPAGIHSVELDGSMLSNGIYFYQLNHGKSITCGKMVLLK